MAADHALSCADQLLSLTISSNYAGVRGGHIFAAAQRARVPQWRELPRWFREFSASYAVANPEGLAVWVALQDEATRGSGVEQEAWNVIKAESFAALRVPTLLLTGLLALISTASCGQEAIGSTTSVKPQAEANSRMLSTGGSVYSKELIHTGDGGAANLRFHDNSNLSVGPQSSVRLDKFVYDYDSDKKAGSIVLDSPRARSASLPGSHRSRLTLSAHPSPQSRCAETSLIFSYFLTRPYGSCFTRALSR